MRLIRFQKKDLPPAYGWVLDDKIGHVEGNIFQEFRRMEAVTPLTDVQLLPPVEPGKILCVGRNYIDHAKEFNNEVPEIPLIFMKPNNSLLGHGGIIRIPPQSQRVDHEGELVVVIGKKGRWIPIDDAKNHIFGYTIGIDVTARDLQRIDKQWTRAKGFDTFGPLGPWVDTEFEPNDAILTTHVNGQMRQMASVRDMVFSISHLVAFISSFTTLYPGDIIMTGTPAGVGPLVSGDIVEVTIEGLGTLRNRVESERSRDLA